MKYENKMETGNEMLPLNSIFNSLRMEENSIKKIFSLKKFEGNSFHMPKLQKEGELLEREEYRNLLNIIKDNLIDMKKNISAEKITTIFEKSCIYFPSSSYLDYSEISYYDHAKLTAAISACLYLYDKENNNENYKEQYFKNNTVERQKEKFLFVSGEFSGIQDFIYTITSKMAMKSLRGRSFYLELFIEHIIDEILAALDLSRINLLYSGGSQFYLLLPNIKKSEEILNEYRDIINDFLLREVGTKIYFETSFVKATAEELGNGLSEKVKKENKIGALFKNTSIKISKSKINRYSKKQLKELFNENSETNKIENSTKECVICKKAEKEKILLENAREANGVELCNACKNYIDLGAGISKMYSSNKENKGKEIFILEENCNKDSSLLTLPKYPEGYINIKMIDGEKIKIRRR